MTRAHWAWFRLAPTFTTAIGAQRWLATPEPKLAIREPSAARNSTAWTEAVMEETGTLQTFQSSAHRQRRSPVFGPAVFRGRRIARRIRAQVLNSATEWCLAVLPKHTALLTAAPASRTGGSGRHGSLAISSLGFSRRSRDLLGGLSNHTQWAHAVPSNRHRQDCRNPNKTPVCAPKSTGVQRLKVHIWCAIQKLNLYSPRANTSAWLQNRLREGEGRHFSPPIVFWASWRRCRPSPSL